MELSIRGCACNYLSNEGIRYVRRAVYYLIIGCFQAYISDHAEEAPFSPFDSYVAAYRYVFHRSCGIKFHLEPLVQGAGDNYAQVFLFFH